MGKLSSLRTQAKLTQTEVASAIGVTQGAISSWERGKKNPALNKLPMLAKLYGVTEQEVLVACTSPSASPSTSIISEKEAIENV